MDNLFSKRQNQYSKLVQKEITDILTKNGKDWFPGLLISVTMVRISPDLSYAKVFVSIYPFEKSKEVVDILNTNIKMIRGLMGNSIRNQVRSVPEIVFKHDDTLDFIDRIDAALKNA